MVWLVIEVNIIISIFGFYLAWKIWRFRQILLAVESNLSLINNCTIILTQTPEILENHHQKVNQLRQQYQQLNLQIQQLQQLVSMFWLLRNVWHRFRRIWH